eukprot:7380718-Prymnesium_polylepis.1
MRDNAWRLEPTMYKVAEALEWPEGIARAAYPKVRASPWGNNTWRRAFLSHIFQEAVITYDHTTHRKAVHWQLFREARRHCSCPDYALV